MLGSGLPCACTLSSLYTVQCLSVEPVLGDFVVSFSWETLSNERPKLEARAVAPGWDSPGWPHGLGGQHPELLNHWPETVSCWKVSYEGLGVMVTEMIANLKNDLSGIQMNQERAVLSPSQSA